MSNITLTATASNSLLQRSNDQPTNKVPTTASAKVAFLNVLVAYLKGTPVDDATVRSAGSEVAPGSI